MEILRKYRLFSLFLMLPSIILFAQEQESISWRQGLSQHEAWYGSQEARRIADQVLIYQYPNGGWAKNIDMAAPLSQAGIKKLQKEQQQDLGTTIDNGATHTQIRFLGKMYEATGAGKYKEAFLNGIDYLLEAQYENGGWPQFYPIRNGYYKHITYNDNAMIGVMRLLREVAQANYSFVPKKTQIKAEKATDRGLQIILKTQVMLKDTLTVWCAQHDKSSLLPAKARAYELPSLSGKESVEILEYLIKIENPSDAVKKAIVKGVQWFENHKVQNIKMEWVPVSDPSASSKRERIAVTDSTAKPLWARFYSLQTQRPIYVGRDGIPVDNYNEIERERRNGYSYLGDYADDLLQKEFPRWKAKHLD